MKQVRRNLSLQMTLILFSVGLSIMFLQMVRQGQMRPFVVPTYVRRNLKSLAIQIIPLHSGVPVE